MSDLKKIIKLALKEDMPQGDITTESLKSGNLNGKALLIAKETLVLSGREVFEMTFLMINPQIKIKWNYKNGETVKNRKVICEIKGELSSILKAERVALNFLGHLSGIATLTSQFVNKIKNTKTKITDTRKTTPGLRFLEKSAVLHGGGVNHRMSLSDQVLIKENHIKNVRYYARRIYVQY